MEPSANLETGQPKSCTNKPLQLGLGDHLMERIASELLQCWKTLNYPGGNQTEGMPEKHNKLKYTLTTLLLPI